MLDIKRIIQNPELVKTAMKNRNSDVDIDKLLSLDAERKAIIGQSEQLKAKRNSVSAQIPRLAKEGQDTIPLKEEMRETSQQIKKLDESLSAVEQALSDMLLTIPNIPHESVPIGKDSDDNIEMRRWGTPRQFDFEPKAHWDIGPDLGILDFAAAAKVTGARFTFYRGAGARLERALIHYMLELHTVKNKYTEILPPYMVHRNSMQGTGQLPKFEEDAFKVSGTEYFLIPTAEVPVTNLYREQILEQLPIYHTAYSACFRAEAGSAGRDTRGLIRQHQFDKVELVKFVEPENSYNELEALTRDAEKVLQGLHLPYRVVNLSTGDLGFSSAKTYDLEVWMPSYDRYVEISSCSNFEDFQARRANIRYRDTSGKTRFIHTLNGSGVAVGRTLACVLETYQQSDGSVIIPDVLVPFMGVDRIMP